MEELSFRHSVLKMSFHRLETFAFGHSLSKNSHGLNLKSTYLRYRSSLLASMAED